MWNYLEELYLGKNNLNKAFNVIQKKFRSEKNNQILS